MEEFWIQLLAILTLLTQTCSSSNTTELIGAVGGPVTFRIPDTRADAAFWTFGSEPILIVLFRDPPQPIFSKEEYKTRFTVSKSGRALSISPLRMEDAGTYAVDVHGKLFTFILQVYKELPEPTVTCETQECSGSICLVSLRCSVPGAGFGNVSYIWRGRAHLWNEESLVVLAVNKSSQDELDPLMCTAQNAVSSRNVTVTTPGGLCSGSPSNTTELIGAVGGSVTFRSNTTATEGNGALWIFGNDPIAIVAFKDPSQPIFYKEEFKTRFTVSESGRALTISHLRMEDAGTYSVAINRKISTFALQVYKELPEPTVTCETQECSGSICLVSLRCSVPGAGFGNVSYTWRGRDHLWNEESVVLAVNKSSWGELEPLTCTAVNAVSSRNVTVTTLGGLCSGPPSGSWVRIGLMAGFEIAAILSVFLIFFCKSRGYCVVPHGQAGEQSG